MWVTIISVICFAFLAFLISRVYRICKMRKRENASQGALQNEEALDTENEYQQLPMQEQACGQPENNIEIDDSSQFQYQQPQKAIYKGEDFDQHNLNDSVKKGESDF